MKAPEHIYLLFPGHANGRFIWITHNYGQALDNLRANDEQVLKMKHE